MHAIISFPPERVVPLAMCRRALRLKVARVLNESYMPQAMPGHSIGLHVCHVIKSATRVVHDGRSVAWCVCVCV